MLRKFGLAMVGVGWPNVLGRLKRANKLSEFGAALFIRLLDGVEPPFVLLTDKLSVLSETIQRRCQILNPEILAKSDVERKADVDV